MDAQEKINQMLELMDRAAFCVAGGTITYANAAASSRLIRAGDPVAPLIQFGAEEYTNFRQGCLYLSLTVGGMRCDASVTAMDDCHVFSLAGSSTDQLRALAVASQALRDPLNRVMTLADRLPDTVTAGPEASEMLARMNRGLYQILRMVSNMSDAGSPCAPHMELRDVPAVMQEIFEQAAQCCDQLGVRLEFANLPGCVYSLVDTQRLERSIYNILSNSLKYTESGGRIHARLTRRRNTLYLTVTDSGAGLDPASAVDPFNRFRREPGIEDGRHGLGLGLTLVRGTAADHGGTVLLEHGESTGTRITMSLPIRQDLREVKSPVLGIDYAGERSHALVELSDVLPHTLYQNR